MLVTRKYMSQDIIYQSKVHRYSTFNRGNETNSFLRNPDGSIYIGSVWPGYTVFPDWLSGGAGPWWTNEMVTWHNKVAFDGAWIDMSEVGENLKSFHPLSKSVSQGLMRTR